MHEEILIEIARVMRECEEAVLTKIASEQKGELFYDIDNTAFEGESNVGIRKN